MAHMDVLLREGRREPGTARRGRASAFGLRAELLAAARSGNRGYVGNKRMIDEQRRLLAKREDRERVSAQGEAGKLEGLELVFDRG